MKENPPDQNLPAVTPVVAEPGKPEKKYDKAGQPTKLNPQRREKFCQLLRDGNYLETAAYGCGVTPQTVYNWLNAGYEQDRGAERNFFDAVKTAAADAEIDALAKAKEGKLNWQSAAWFLERRYPTKYARREYIQDSRDLKEVSQDDLEKLVAEAIEVKLPTIVNDGEEGNGGGKR